MPDLNFDPPDMHFKDNHLNNHLPATQLDKKSQATFPHGASFFSEILVYLDSWPFGPLVFSDALNDHSYILN